MPGHVDLEAGDLFVRTDDDGEVLVENDTGSAILDQQESFQVAMAILMNHPDVDPFTCPVCGQERRGSLG